MTEFNYVASCLFGLEKFVGEEIDACGGKRTETIDGRVYFKHKNQKYKILSFPLKEGVKW